jgi:hypothetical protein
MASLTRDNLPLSRATTIRFAVNCKWASRACHDRSGVEPRAVDCKLSKTKFIARVQSTANRKSSVSPNVAEKISALSIALDVSL